MSAQNTPKKEPAERVNFLEKNNTIVKPNLSGCLFMKEYFRTQMLIRMEDPLNIKNYPVALLTVLGSNKNYSRMLYTDWLITFFENQKQSPMSTIETCDKLRYIDELSNPPAGIYIWPTKYVLGRKKSSDMVLLILYTNEGNVQALRSFATVACSNIFILDDIDKGVLEDGVKEIFAQVDKKPGNLFPCTSTLLSLPENYRRGTAATIFLEQLGNMELTPIKRGNGAELKFKNLGIFLQNVEDKINAAIEPSILRQYSEAKMSPVYNPTEPEVDTRKPRNEDLEVGDPEVDQLTNMVATLNVEDQGQESVSPISEQTAQESILKEESINTGKGSSCEELHCGLILPTLQQLVENWVSVNLTSENISSLNLCYQEYQIYDKHNIFEEIDELISILYLHNTQLNNLFDNYVCFADEIDFQQFQLLAKAVHSRSLDKLTAKNHKHFSLTNNILQVVAKQLHLLYVKDNERIKIAEKHTAKKVNNILVSMLIMCYNDFMVTLLKQESKHSSIYDSHILIRDMLISIAEKCMNFGDRFNGIAKLYLLKLGNGLESLFIDLKKHYIKTECSFIVLETYIEEFLTIFYGNKHSNLFEQSIDEVVKRHDNVVTKVTSDGIQGARKSNLQLRLDMHLLYITEVISQANIIKGIGKEAASNPFCLHLTSKFYSLHLKTNIGNNLADYQGDPQPAYVALTKRDNFVFDYEARHLAKKNPTNAKACGSILDFLCDTTFGRKYNTVMIENFFKKILYDVEKASNCKNHNVIIIIPQNLFLEDRLRLRNIAKSAGINHIFLVSETSILAYNQICLRNRAENNNADVFVPIKIYDDGIRVDIFEEQSENRVQLSAVAFQSWKGCVSKSSSSWKFWEKNITNPFSHNYSTADCKSTLQAAILFAFSQVDISVTKKPIKFCILSEYSKYHNIFDQVLKERPNWSETNIFQLNYPNKAAMHFSNNPFSLVTSILDHGVNVKYFAKLENTILQNHLKGNETSHNLILPSDPSLLENKKRLLQRCHDMRSQLSSGSVDVRRLTKKLITECIDRAEKIATDIYTTQEMIVSEHKELIELFNEHNFS